MQHLQAEKGQLGQQYRSVEQAIKKQGCDIIIVGQGITRATEVVSAAKQYRDTAWQAYNECV